MRTPSLRLGCVWLFCLFWGVGTPRGAEEPGVTTRKPNRLVNEASPYLRQHAYNPVDWYPWGPEAFEKARRENKPIFLSIGYATCHWCHVMERESFADPEIAALLNDGFVPVKVDRQERPDVDRLYMAFVQASTGAGGWPLNVWLTPELKPFFGGTYFPPETRGRQVGLKAVLKRMQELWATQRAKLEQRSAEVVTALAAETAGEGGSAEYAAWREAAFAQLTGSFDRTHGGFEAAPKFPPHASLPFLLELAVTSTDAKRREAVRLMATKTLTAMSRGGIHDQVGGGFHRYATDAAWRVPHFEKMLSDQAQLANAYLTAWQITQDPEYRATATATLDYVYRDMRSADGGFYAAEDADSAGGATAAGGGAHQEGAYYVWTEAEFDEVVGDADRALLKHLFGITKAGNAGAELSGTNVLHQATSVEAAAARFNLTTEAVRTAAQRGLKKLAERRSQRARPARDEQVLVTWNGLMISAFARGAQVLGEARYGDAAERAAEYLRSNLYDAQTGRLRHSSTGAPRDFAEDYAFLIQGLLDLYETRFDVRWLQWAVELQERQNALFLDPQGGYFATPADDPTVVLRLKEQVDGAEPASNSVAVRNLCRLAALLHRDEWRELARRCVTRFHPQFTQAPLAMPLLLSATGWLERDAQQVVVHGPAAGAATAKLIGEVWRRFAPYRVLIRVDERSASYLAGQLDLVAGLPPCEPDRATAYVCENFACQEPTSDPEILAQQLAPAGGQLAPGLSRLLPP